MQGAMLRETKTIQTANDPAAIDSANEWYGRFFWNVQNVQVTHLKNNHDEYHQYGDLLQIEHVTETTQYATITYERDKRLPHHRELVALEQECADLESRIRAAENEDFHTYTKRFFAYYFGGAFALVGLFLSPQMFMTGHAWATILPILLGVGIICLRNFKNRKITARKAELSSMLENDLRPALAEANANVDELYDRVMAEL